LEGAFSYELVKGHGIKGSRSTISKEDQGALIWGEKQIGRIILHQEKKVLRNAGGRGTIREKTLSYLLGS